MLRRPPLIAVCGPAVARDSELHDARVVGELLAQRGAHIVCGGLGGVMAACAEGVAAQGGTCIGLLPGDDPGSANPHVTVALATALGEMRNALIARCCAGMVAIGGGHGTLSEIGLALRLGRPVALLRSWRLQPPDASVALRQRVLEADSPQRAVAWILEQTGAIS